MAQDEQKTTVICLTGQMAAGKNYISSLLEDENCVSIDLDKTVHTAISMLTPQIYDLFKEDAKIKGIELLNQDGSINRRQLGSLLFSNPQLLKKQETLVYPAVIQLTKDFIQKNPGKTVLINATVLYKTPELMELCEKIYFVRAAFFKRLYRAKRRDQMPILQIIKRFWTQKSLLLQYKNTGKPVILISN